MYGRSNALGPMLELLQGAVDATRSNEARLPTESRAVATALEKRIARLYRLNVRQEAAKAELAAATQALRAELREAMGLRGRLVSYAEAMFGRFGLELRQYRPLVRGRHHRRRPKAEAGPENTNPAKP
jgi:hypothetical protein